MHNNITLKQERRHLPAAVRFLSAKTVAVRLPPIPLVRPHGRDQACWLIEGYGSSPAEAEADMNRRIDKFLKS